MDEGCNEAFAAEDEGLHDGVRRPITLADVAREARVGESTVSRVLRSHGSFSEKTRARVEEAVARLGYVPNRIAGTLASTGSRLIGIVIPSLTNIVFRTSCAARPRPSTRRASSRSSPSPITTRTGRRPWSARCSAGGRPG